MSVPYDRFARLIQTSVTSVAVRALSNTLNFSVFINACNCIRREIRYPDITFIVYTHSVRGTQLGGIFCPYVISKYIPFHIHLYAVNSAVTEVSYKEVARFVENNSIQSVLYFWVLCDNGSNKVFIF